jgi:hypothetical protein
VVYLVVWWRIVEHVFESDMCPVVGVGVLESPMDVVSSVAMMVAGLDGLLGSSMVGLAAAELTELARSVERIKRRLVAVEHAYVAELDTRQVAVEACMPNTAVFLSQLLRISPGEARARVRAAANLRPRVGFSGGVLPALFDTVAAAQVSGAISAEHAGGGDRCGGR